MHKVAEPVPALALITSSAPNLSRVVSDWRISPSIWMAGFAWLNNGMMVSAEWPPTTGIKISEGDIPEIASAANVDALTTSRVVIPKSFFGLNTFFDFKTSAISGTSELTGLEMTKMEASGHVDAIPIARSRMMPALNINKSTINPWCIEKHHLESCPASRLVFG